MSFAVVLEGMTLITYAVILSGGMQKRAVGWKILSGLLLLVGVVELACMTIMVSRPLVAIARHLKPAVWWIVMLRNIRLDLSVR